jgi:hypothetical protein
VRYTIESIERRVIDPVANTRITNNPFAADGDVDAIPNGVLATDENRLQKEEIGRQSVAAKQRVAAVNNLSQLASFSFVAGTPLEPIPAALAAKALQQVDQSLIKEGLLDQRGKLSEETKKSLSFERVSSLPTPGLLVKGCLDECNICEETLMKEMDLDLARKQLENELLKKQIDLLDKSQEYRCCPAGSEETP